MNKHSISSAIYAIQTAANFGYEGLKAFTLTREAPHILANDFDEENETYDEFIERLATACWMGQDYFRMWLGDENITLQSHELTNLNLPDGVYYMDFQGHESHHWVWIINGSDIWYAGTYGGVCDLTVKKFNKHEYITRFASAMSGSLDDYAYVFQVNPVDSEVGLESLSYMKSDRY